MYKIMFYVGLVGAIISLGFSVILFVRNNVAKLIGDMTGWNAQRAKKKFDKVREKEATALLSVPVGFFEVEESFIVTHTEERIDIE